MTLNLMAGDLVKITDEINRTFERMIDVHEDCLDAIEKDPNMKLADWLKTYQGRTPITKLIQELGSVLGLEYDDSDYKNRPPPVEDSYPWEEVLNENPLELVNVDIPEFAKVIDGKKVRKFVIEESPGEAGYFQFEDGTVYRYSLEGTPTIEKLRRCKLWFHDVDSELEASCRIVKF